MRVVGRKAFGDVTLVQDGGGEQLHFAVPEPPTKPSPWGWELPEPLPHTRMREKELLPLLPFHGHFQLSLPWPVPELVGGLTGALTGPALGRAHLVQTQQRLSCPCGISSLQQHQWLCR